MSRALAIPPQTKANLKQTRLRPPLPLHGRLHYLSDFQALRRLPLRESFLSSFLNAPEFRLTTDNPSSDRLRRDPFTASAASSDPGSCSVDLVDRVDEGGLVGSLVLMGRRPDIQVSELLFSPRLHLCLSLAATDTLARLCSAIDATSRSRPPNPRSPPNLILASHPSLHLTSPLCSSASLEPSSGWSPSQVSACRRRELRGEALTIPVTRSDHHYCPQRSQRAQHSASRAHSAMEVTAPGGAVVLHTADLRPPNTSLGPFAAGGERGRRCHRPGRSE